MFKILLAILLSLSIALPGIAMASHEHHAQMTAAHPGDAHHDHDHAGSCGASECEIELVKTCCATMAGHCNAMAIPVASSRVALPLICEAAKLSHGVQQVLVGQTFEADPPPPRA